GPPSIGQWGGQTATNIASPLAPANQPILGSSAEAIDIAEDRSRFEELLQRLGIPQPPGAAVNAIEHALSTAQLIGYPVLVRPSYVLGGRAMEIVQNPRDLVRYVTNAVEIAAGKPILIDKYLEGIEAEVDAICDGEQTLIPGVMEHVERAGVHSGDSLAVYPAIGLHPDEVEKMVDYTTRLGPALGVKGLMNVQYVIMRPEPKRPDGPPSDVYVLEVNPRASRTVPFLSKVTGVPMVRLAVQVMLGKTLADLGYALGLIRDLAAAGYRLCATAGTAAMIRAMDLEVEQVPKRIEEGHPNVVDVIQDGLVDAVINTPEGRVTETLRDGFEIRRAAAEKRIPCLTTIDTAAAAISSLVRDDPHFTVQPLRDYLSTRA